MRSIRFGFGLAGWSLVILAIAGCGGGGEGRVSLSGKVTVNGRPLEAQSASISLVPLEGTEGPSAGTEIVDGAYSISADEGPFPGKHSVRIVAMRKTGEKFRDEFAKTPDKMIDAVAQFLPAQYNRQSTLTVELKPGANPDVDFKLQLKE